MRFVFLQYQTRVTVYSLIISSMACSFLCMLARPAHASTALLDDSARLADMRLRAVLQSTSQREINTAVVETERIKIGRIECDIQLKGRRVPSKCFEVLKDETEAGLIAAASKKSHEEWLTQLCKKRAQNSNDLRELNLLADSKIIPQVCHEQVLARALDLKYASESEDPSGLFISRFEHSVPEKVSPRPNPGHPAQKLQADISISQTNGQSVDEPWN